MSVLYHATHSLREVGIAAGGLRVDNEVFPEEQGEFVLEVFEITLSVIQLTETLLRSGSLVGTIQPVCLEVCI